MQWSDIDAPPPSKPQRVALYKFGITKKVAHSLTPSEASEMLSLLVRAAKRQAQQWTDAATTADDLLK